MATTTAPPDTERPSERPEPRRREPLLKPVDRRTFLRTSWLAGLAGATGAFGAASLGFLWPNLSGGFGAQLNLGDAEEILAGIKDTKAPFAYPAGRLYVVKWETNVPGANEQYGTDHQAIIGNEGLMALYQKCVHLGCRVPWCQSSQWFECPCHGSKYNRWGEWQSGPAPRGLDRFPSLIDAEGNLIVDTGTTITGPARTVAVLAQEPEGPHCIDL